MQHAYQTFVDEREIPRTLCAAAGREHLTYEVWGEYVDRWRRTTAGLRIADRRMLVSCELGTRDVLGPPR